MFHHFRHSNEQRYVFIPAELGQGLYRPFYRDHSVSFLALDLPVGGGVEAYPGVMRGDVHWILEEFGCFRSLLTLGQLLERK